MPLPEDLRELHAQYSNPMRLGNDNRLVVELIERINVLTAENARLKHGACCREPWCEGICTCEICAPGLALHDLRAERDKFKEEVERLSQRGPIRTYLPVSY